MYRRDLFKSDVVDPDHTWNTPATRLVLNETDVHLWRAGLDQPEWVLLRLEQLLSSDERARADRFRFEQDRHRFIVCRGVLRIILSGYLDIMPNQVQFRYSPQGKPALAVPHGDDLHFNLSNSGALAVYVVTRHRVIGIDLEYLRLVPDADQIAERFFSAAERSIFRALPIDQKHEAFYNCWTRKEAFIKALGEGLTHPLDRFDVSLVPDEPAALLSIDGDSLAALRWTVQQFIPEPNYTAALAVEGRDLNISFWQWSNFP